MKAWLGIAFGTAFAMLGAIGPACADRPGTPTDLNVTDCGFRAFGDGTSSETICGTFKSAATEDVLYESRITENGKPTGPELMMDCPPQVYQFPVPVCIVGGSQHDHQVVQYLVRPAKFDTTYCIAFRARRKSDQIVSQQWTSSVCARTAPPPPLPAKPPISIKYFNKVDESGNTTPQVDIVSSPVPKGTQRQDDFRHQGDSTAVAKLVDKSINDHWTYEVTKNADNEDDIVTIDICDTNGSGKACSTRVINATKQQDVSIDGALPIKITGRATGQPVQPLPPRPTSGFDGTWSVTTD
ncbi:MAG TPA: hypothetical protein VGF97_18760, partial [Rhizomicrobium sp.]